MIEILCSGLGGYLLNILVQKYKNSKQKMSCIYLEDDILSKIPQRNTNGDITQNVHKKHFQLKNTTNIDIEHFKVVFQFDTSSIITECYSRSKEGIDYQRIKKDNRLQNQAVATVKFFNRGDIIDYYFTVENVTENEYYVKESDAIGFAIKYKDKRKDTKKSKSSMSNTLLINNSYV